MGWTYTELMEQPFDVVEKFVQLDSMFGDN